MTRNKMKAPADPERQAQLRAELRRDRDARQQGYREKALKLFAPVCARCCRDFAGPKLKELTVHHRDHNHNNNPPDGSNWELLCVYCHDHEHEKHRAVGLFDVTDDAVKKQASLGNPFDQLRHSCLT